jgi:hypothetical protein
VCHLHSDSPNFAYVSQTPEADDADHDQHHFQNLALSFVCAHNLQVSDAEQLKQAKIFIPASMFIEMNQIYIGFIWNTVDV